MGKRTILIFPEFENTRLIQDIRKKYDPLANLIMPHITLVYPFDGKLTDEELNLHMKSCLADMPSFAIELKGFSKQAEEYGFYLFLNIVRGMEMIQRIHDRLYTGELKQFDAGSDYIPHMTVGKVHSVELLEEAFDDANQCEAKFSTMVQKISVEMIGDHEESIIIMEHALA